MHKFSQIPVDVSKINTKYRYINTPIPAPGAISIINDCAKYEPDSMNNQLPIVWDKATNFLVWDTDGNCFIDFTSGIFITNVGHAHPKVLEAIKNTIEKPLLNAYYYPTSERAAFSKKLIEVTPDNIDKVLFLSTGSEAVEAAIKMSIKFTGRKKILSFQKSFHGKTMGAQLAGGKKHESSWIPTNTYVEHLPFPYSWILESEQKSGIDYFNEIFENINGLEYAAVISEPYQGWCAGFLPIDFALALRKWCTENGVLLIIDEVQSGFGRTGKLFAFEHFGIKPDIITCGKGISSSLPLSAVLTRAEIVNTDDSFNSTHGGNPVAVATSLASLNALIDEDLIKASEEKGKILEIELNKWKIEFPNIITRIICKGLLASVFIKPQKGDEIDFVDKLIEVAMRKGLISVRTCSGTLKIGPPLTIPIPALIEGVNVLKESLVECLGMLE